MGLNSVIIIKLCAVIYNVVKQSQYGYYGVINISTYIEWAHLAIWTMHNVIYYGASVFGTYIYVIDVFLMLSNFHLFSE